MLDHAGNCGQALVQRPRIRNALERGIENPIAAVGTEGLALLVAPQQRRPGCARGRGCGFDLHAFHSDEIGRGPYTDNYWDLVVRDGKVASAQSTWAYLTNGFSNEMWTPFQSWVASTHPLDIQLMYVGQAPAMTEESIRLWEQRTREYADAVNAGAA